MAASVPKEEVVSLPWDPIWDYMLNDHDLDDMTTQQDDECSSKGFFMREEDESVDWGPKKDAGSRTKARRSVRSERTRSANRSRRFWRRGRQESGITRTSELIEEVELKDDESYDRKGKKGITKWIGGKGTGRNPTEHSNFEEERETTQERVQTPREQELVARDSEQRSPPEQEPPEQEGFFKLGGLLEVWGGSTSEDSEESSQSEETSFEASNASEEISTTTEDISVIDEVSLSLTEVSKSPKQEVNEVRLAFKPFLDESSGSFAAMLDIGSFEKTPNDKQSFLEGNNLGNDINELDGEEDIVDLNNADKFEPASDALGPVTSTKEPEIPVDPIIQSASNETKGGTKKAVSAGTRNQSMRKLRPNRVVCRSITDLSSRQRKIATETGIPIHELSKEDLATYFPKLRTVVDDKAEVIGNCNSFEAFLPAHLQTTLLRRGKPQSLYEYEYETGKHMFVSYSAFGPDARSLIELRPGPELKDNPTGMATALMQVEVCCHRG